MCVFVHTYIYKVDCCCNAAVQYNISLHTLLQWPRQSINHGSDHIPYLALTGTLWGVFSEDFGENWPRFNGTALYTHINVYILPIFIIFVWLIRFNVVFNSERAYPTIPKPFWYRRGLIFVYSYTYMKFQIQSILIDIIPCQITGENHPIVTGLLGPLLLTWIDFNPSMDKVITCLVKCDEITYPFPNFNGCTVEVWEWISNFITHFMMDVITYSCWD